MLRKDIHVYLDMTYNTFGMVKTIYDYLSAMSDGWIYNAPKPNPSGTQMEAYIVRKISKKPDRGYGFRIVRTPDSNYPAVYIYPALVFFENEGSNTVSDAAYTLVNPIMTNGNNRPQYTNSMDCRLTIGVGKQDKTAFISVVPNDSGYVLMSAVCGEDSNGDPYALAPGYVYNNAAITGRFITYVDGTSHEAVTNAFQTESNANSFFGFIETSKLILSPFLNPITGASCYDLYFPIGGPRSVQLYNVSVGGRSFITGTSASASSITSDITASNYDAGHKVFLEV